jgi:protocatechuate 3,4-dioxygenase beta subunit
VKRYSRRDFVASTGAIAACALSAAGSTQDGTAFRDGHTPITQPELDEIARREFGGKLTCVRTPESVDGPYYIESSQERRSIAEAQRGVRLRLGITVLNAHLGGNVCGPLRGCIVDIWQANAQGVYSNEIAALQGTDTTGQTFLRGHQVTDDNGYVEFDTIVPGWEIVPVPAPVIVVQRTTHIHVKVFSEHKVATTQLYLPDQFLDELYSSVEPYSAYRSLKLPGSDRHYDRIRNTADHEYLTDKAKPMDLARERGGIVAKALIGVTTLGSRGIKTLFR